MSGPPTGRKGIDMKQTRRVLVILLLLPSVALWLWAHVNAQALARMTPAIYNGVMDLGEWKANGSPSFRMSGEWELYPGRLMDAAAICGSPGSLLINVPYSRQKMTTDGLPLYISDPATYRIHVINYPPDVALAIQVRQMTSAYRLYIDDRQIAWNGYDDDTRESPISAYRYQISRFFPEGDGFDVILQIYNQYDNKGVSQWPIVLGTYDNIRKSEKLTPQIDYLSAGVLLAVSLFLMIIWLMFPREKELLVLCIFGAVKCVHLMVSRDILVAELFPQMSLIVFRQIDYIATYGVRFLMAASIFSMYPAMFPRWFMRSLLAVLLGVFLYGWGTPYLMVFSHIALVFDMVMALIFLGIAVFLIRAVLDGQPNSRFLLVFASCMAVIMLSDFHSAEGALYYLLADGGLGFETTALLECSLIMQRIRKSRALELSALRGQIQPHFIHNALAAIISISRRDPSRSRELLIDFSSYLRGKFDYINVDFITIEQELELVRAYAALEQARFVDKFEVEYQIEVGGFLLPPLLLQPLVENALTHGLRDRESGGKVCVYALREGKKVRVGVRDNGVGIQRQAVPDKPVRRSGIGVSNINYRLNRLYGTELHYRVPSGGGCEAYMEITYREAAVHACNTD